MLLLMSTFLLSLPFPSSLVWGQQGSVVRKVDSAMVDSVVLKVHG